MSYILSLVGNREVKPTYYLTLYQCLHVSEPVSDFPQTWKLDDAVGIEQYSENKNCWSISVDPKIDFEPHLNPKIGPFRPKKPTKLGQTQK